MNKIALGILLAACGALGMTGVRAADRPPNIIFILADDLGYTDLGVQGSSYYETPNIDRLASEGLRLTNYHQCQNCAPTRAALMSGQYGSRTGVYTVGGINRFDWQSRPLRPVDNITQLPLDKITIAQTLKKAGYVTGMFGKWHLGSDPEYLPMARGFDEAIVSSSKHFDFKTIPEMKVPPGTYLADFLTDQAVAFIDRNKDRPFFLYLPHFGVHAPYEAKKETVARFEGKKPVGGHRDPTYAAMIASVDESVGRVMAELDKLHLADDTVLIFASDNGGLGGYQREGITSNTGRALDVTDNAPLRSGKGSLYEGGTRVPFIVRWPGVTKPGSTSNVPTIHVDMYPTLAQIAGAKLPTDYPLDGVSMVPLFRDSATGLSRDAIYQHFPGYLGTNPGVNEWRTTPVGTITEGNFKLMEFFEDGHLELYDLQKDLGEQHNLAQEMPDKAKAMRDKLVAWRESIRAPMPTKNTPQPFDVNRAPAKKAGED